MADITKCSSQFCPLRLRCYRQLAKSNEQYQSYSNFEYTCNENAGFPDYIPGVRGEIVILGGKQNET